MRRPCSGRALSSVRPSVLCVLLVTACSALWSPPPALAHTSLVSSTPAPDAVVAVPVEVVTLVFSEPVSPRTVQVVVSGPDGADLAAGPVQVSGGTVTRSVGARSTAGSYRLAYRVLAEDGHPITGQVPFEVALSAAGSPTTSAATTTAQPPAAGSAQTPEGASRTAGTTSSAPALLAVLSGLALVLGIGAVRAARRVEPGR